MHKNDAQVFVKPVLSKKIIIINFSALIIILNLFKML